MYKRQELFRDSLPMTLENKNIGETSEDVYKRQEYNSELVSIRCCVLDSSLQIVDEENWNEFIHYNESVVVDTVEKDSEEREMPKIKLKDKARKRMGQRDAVAMRDDTTIGDIPVSYTHLDVYKRQDYDGCHQ